MCGEDFVHTGKGYDMYGTEISIVTSLDVQSTGGICTEDKYTEIIYEERLFGLNRRREKPESRGHRRPNVPGRVDLGVRMS